MVNTSRSIIYIYIKQIKKKQEHSCIFLPYLGNLSPTDFDLKIDNTLTISVQIHIVKHVWFPATKSLLVLNRIPPCIASFPPPNSLT